MVLIAKKTLCVKLMGFYIRIKEITEITRA